MEYTREDVLEMQELLRDNYSRCLLFEQEPEVDNIIYTIKDNKIVACRCADYCTEIVFSDIFDMIDQDFFHYSSVDTVHCEKEVLDTKLFGGWSSRFYGHTLNIEGCAEVMNTTPSGALKRYGNTSVTNIVMNDCKKVGKAAFRNYIKLEFLELGTPEEIGEEAFYGCVRLTKIIAPTVKTLGKGAFKNMSNLVSVDLTGVDSIKSHTFKGCSSLKTVRISSACKKIEPGAFAGLSNLKQLEFVGSSAEWKKLSKNIATWRGESLVEYNRNKITVRFVQE